MDNSPFLLKEYETLQSIVHDLKDCQTKYVAISVSFVAAIFGLIATLNAIHIDKVTNSTITIGSITPNTTYSGLFSLASLIIILPVWAIFFDKARTITRIVGYIGILEKFILDSKMRIYYIGWENSIEQFRKYQKFETNIKSDVVKSPWEEIDSIQRLKFFFEIIFIRIGQYQRYWSIVFATYFWLSIISIFMFIFSTNINVDLNFEDEFAVIITTLCLFLLLWAFFSWKNYWFPRVGVAIFAFSLILMVPGLSITILILAIYLILLATKNNLKILYSLTEGYHSYSANYYYWKYALISINEDKNAILNLLKNAPNNMVEKNNVSSVINLEPNHISYITNFLEKEGIITFNPKEETYSLTDKTG